MKEVVSDYNTAMWVIGILLSIISMLAGFVLWYVKKLIKDAGELGGKISKNNANIIDLKNQVVGVLSSLHTSEKSVWEELISLRRSVVGGTVVLRARRAEVNQIMDDTKRAQSQLAKHDKAIRATLEIAKRNRANLELQKTRIVNIAEDVIMIKEDKDGKGAN